MSYTVGKKTYSQALNFISAIYAVHSAQFFPIPSLSLPTYYKVPSGLSDDKEDNSSDLSPEPRNKDTVKHVRAH